jgi:hypothetical protein
MRLSSQQASDMSICNVARLLLACRASVVKPWESCQKGTEQR